MITRSFFIIGFSFRRSFKSSPSSYHVCQFTTQTFHLNRLTFYVIILLSLWNFAMYRILKTVSTLCNIYLISFFSALRSLRCRHIFRDEIHVNLVIFIRYLSKIIGMTISNKMSDHLMWLRILTCFWQTLRTTFSSTKQGGVCDLILANRLSYTDKGN